MIRFKNKQALLSSLQFVPEILGLTHNDSIFSLAPSKRPISKSDFWKFPVDFGNFSIVTQTQSVLSIHISCDSSHRDRLLLFSVLNPFPPA